jgi:hypothetical protein
VESYPLDFSINYARKLFGFERDVDEINPLHPLIFMGWYIHENKKRNY